MGRFTVRVELHDSKESDYNKLHGAMKDRGFLRTIKIGSGNFLLPSGEYNFVGRATRKTICDKAAAAANATKRAYAILVTEGVRTFRHLPPATARRR